jgi:hypothetical protein
MAQVRSLSVGTVPGAELGLGSLIVGPKPNSVPSENDNQRPRAGRGMIAASVEPTGNGSTAARLDTAAEWLGYLGLVPLVLGLAGVGLLPEYAGRELAQRIALAWGAVLLTFTGAVHFGLALAGRLPWEAQRLGAAVLPAVAGAGALLVGGQRGLALLVVGFGLFWLYEHRALGALLPPAYLSLRRNLSLATCMLLALTMIASDAAARS